MPPSVFFPVSKVKVEVAGYEPVEVEEEYAGFVRAALQRGLSVADAFTDDSDPDAFVVVLFREEDVSLLAEAAAPSAASLSPVLRGSLMADVEDSEAVLTYFVDLPRSSLQPVSEALVSGVLERPEPGCSEWDGALVPPVPGSPHVDVGWTVLVTLHSTSNVDEDVPVLVTRVDGDDLHGEVVEDSLYMSNVRKGTLLRFRRHHIRDAEEPAPSLLN